ncbi:MAG: FAD-binding oxidoreductase [Candidatus Hodarchaeota archaeon]
MEKDNIIKSLQKKLPWNKFLSIMETEGFIATSSPNFSQLTNIEEYKNVFLSGKAIFINNKIQSAGLNDPSYLHLTPYVLFRPKTENQLKKIIIHSQKLKIPITFACGKTGLSGGYSNYGITADLADLHSFKDAFTIDLKKEEIIVEQSALISDLIKYVQYLSKGKYIFPIQPASALKLPVRVGGVISSNASGVTSGKLGSAEDWIISMRIMNPNGAILQIERNDPLFNRIIGGNGYYGVILSAKFKLYKPPLESKRAILYGNKIELAFNGLQSILNSKVFPLISEFVVSNEKLPGKFNDLKFKIKNELLQIKWAVLIKGTSYEVNEFINIMRQNVKLNFIFLDENEFQDYLQERSTFALLVQTTDSSTDYIAFPGFEDILSEPKNLPEIIDLINNIFENHGFHKIIFGYGHINFRRGQGLLLHMRLPVPIEYFYRENEDKLKDVSHTVYDVIITLKEKYNVKHKAEHSSGPFVIWLDQEFRRSLQEDIEISHAFENPHLRIYEELQRSHGMQFLNGKEKERKRLFIEALSLYLSTF